MEILSLQAQNIQYGNSPCMIFTLFLLLSSASQGGVILVGTKATTCLEGE